MSMSDGVSKIWILRTFPIGDRDHAGLSVDGCKDEHEAIDGLIRHLLTRTMDRDAEKARIHATVERALKHMSEDEEDAGART